MTIVFNMFRYKSDNLPYKKQINGKAVETYYTEAEDTPETTTIKEKP